MIRLFKHYVPYAVLLLGVIDFAAADAGAAEAGWSLRLWQLGGRVDPDVAGCRNLIAFAGTLQVAMVAVGVYSVTRLAVDALRRRAAARRGRARHHPALA